jgi:hypothetical protein
MGVFFALIVLLVVKYPHRVTRIQSWIEVLTSKRNNVPSTTGLDFTLSKLHDGMFIYNEWSTVAFALVATLFAWLVVVLWKSGGSFAKSISILWGITMLLHFIVVMNWSTIIPPSLFIVEQGTTVTLVSFLMLGMSLMMQDESKR